MSFFGALWLITSAYTTQLQVYPSMQMCAAFTEALTINLQKPPRPILGRYICVPIAMVPKSDEEPKLSM